MTEARDFFRRNTEECVTVRSVENFFDEIRDDIEEVRYNLDGVDKNNIDEVMDAVEQAISDLVNIIRSMGY